MPVIRPKNYEHLHYIAKCIAKPDSSVKELNRLYALRNAWVARGYLLDRELLMLSQWFDARPDAPQTPVEPTPCADCAELKAQIAELQDKKDSVTTASKKTKTVSVKKVTNDGV